jgi:hypothetical protein
MPWRSGWPSGVSGGVHVFTAVVVLTFAAAVRSWPAAEAGARYKTTIAIIAALMEAKNRFFMKPPFSCLAREPHPPHRYGAPSVSVAKLHSNNFGVKRILGRGHINNSRCLVVGFAILAADLGLGCFSVPHYRSEVSWSAISQV